MSTHTLTRHAQLFRVQSGEKLESQAQSQHIHHSAAYKDVSKQLVLDCRALLPKKLCQQQAGSEHGLVCSIRQRQAAGLTGGWPRDPVVQLQAALWEGQAGNAENTASLHSISSQAAFESWLGVELCPGGSSLGRLPQPYAPGAAPAQLTATPSFASWCSDVSAPCCAGAGPQQQQAQRSADAGLPV